MLVHPDALADANDLEILRGVAQVIRRTGRNRQKLGDFLHPVNKRFVRGCFGLVRRFNGRGFVRIFCQKSLEISDRKFAWSRMLLTPPL